MSALTSTSMIAPWESLRVHVARGILAADNGLGGASGPEIDLYDVSTDCPRPQLLASVPVGTGTGGGVVPSVKAPGHEGGARRTVLPTTSGQVLALRREQTLSDRSGRRRIGRVSGPCGNERTSRLQCGDDAVSPGTGLRYFERSFAQAGLRATLRNTSNSTHLHRPRRRPCDDAR